MNMYIRNKSKKINDIKNRYDIQKIKFSEARKNMRLTNFKETKDAVISNTVRYTDVEKINKQEEEIQTRL